MNKAIWIRMIVPFLALFVAATLLAQDFDVEVKDDESASKKEKKKAEIVVTGTRTKKYLRTAPVKTNLVTREDIEKKGAMNLFDSLMGESGVVTDSSCMNCAVNGVGLNGLPSNYTQMLFNGIPTLSSLASVYFLQQYPAELIQRIEIVKGGGSATYGSGAVGGVVNVITRKPVTNEANVTYKQEFVGLKNSFAYTVNGYASAVTNDGRAGIAVFGSKFERDPYDRNGDGVSETPMAETLSYGLNTYYTIVPGMELTLDYTGINEFRRGGDDFDEAPHYSGITEQSDSKNNFATLTFAHDVLSKKALGVDYKVYFGYSNIDRKTYYGPEHSNPTTDPDVADNAEMYGFTDSHYFSAGAQGNVRFMKLHTITVGYDFMGETMKDINQATAQKQDHFYQNHGVFVQYDLDLDFYEVVAGVRMDRHSELDTFVFSPRISMIGNFLDDKLHARLSYSMGFKAPQIFDEDYHIGVSIEGGGGLPNVIKNVSDLKKESSHTVTADFSGEFVWKAFDLDFSIGGFWTRMLDAMYLENQGDQGGWILWERKNTNGYSDTIGANAELGFQYARWVKLTNGLTVIFLNRYYDYDGDELVQDWGTSDVPRQPNVSGFSRVDFFWKDLTVTANVQYLGSMIVPYDDESKYRTTKFMPVVDLRVDYRFKLSDGKHLNIFGGVENLTNAFMEDRDITGLTDRDPTLVYGPVKPLTFFVGTKLSI